MEIISVVEKTAIPVNTKTQYRELYAQLSQLPADKALRVKVASHSQAQAVKGTIEYHKMPFTITTRTEPDGIYVYIYREE